MVVPFFMRYLNLPTLRGGGPHPKADINLGKTLFTLPKTYTHPGGMLYAKSRTNFCFWVGKNY
jgi:hypothetical protein